ncbi:MAG TPA: DUF4350 domain-containing protein [Gemmatimonadales bacterium]|jgi:hypothetical protein
MSYRLEIGTALLLAAAIAIGLWAAHRKPRAPDLDFRTSTYLSGPSGSKALHEILVRLGRLSERRRTPLLTLATQRAHRPAILVLLNPIIELQEAELEQVARYVRAGGAVVAAGDGAGVTECTGWRIQSGGIGNTDTIGVRSLETDVRLPVTERVLTFRKPEPTAELGHLERLRKGAPEDSRPGICNTLVPFTVDTVVVALNNRPAILRLRYRSGGTITLVADPRWFTNRAWRDSNLPMALLPLLTPRAERPGRVVWDEYHQGFGYGNQASFSARTWDWVRTTPAGWALLQLIAVALAWLAMTSVRFGPAREGVERRRRSPLEHLEALGAGLESAGDTDTAVARLALGLRRRLSRSGHAGDGQLLPWLESLELAMRGPQGRAAVRRLHHLLTARDRDEQRVLLAAQAVEDVWEELRPRPRETRNAS